MNEAATAPPDQIHVTDVKVCPRCCQSHPGVQIRLLRRRSGTGWTHWCMCPVTQEDESRRGAAAGTGEDRAGRDAPLLCR